MFPHQAKSLSLGSETPRTREVMRRMSTLYTGANRGAGVGSIRVDEQPDRIIVVEDHGIVESGSHRELVAARGRYAAMYATWEAHT